MISPQQITRIFVLLAGVLFINTTYANQKLQSPASAKISKEGKTYASASLAFNEFRSLLIPLAKSDDLDYTFERKFPLTAQTYALSVSLGTYIVDNFKTELRYGTGIIDDTVDEVLDVNLHYYFNWYIGGTIPVNEVLSAYALIGVSFYEADITKREVNRKIQIPGEPFTEFADIQVSPNDLDEDLFGTKFSMSWMLGLDYQLNKDWYLAFEYGRLLKDTDSNIKVYQGNMQLRYEF